MLQVENRQNTCLKGLVAVGSNLTSSAGDARATVAVALQLLGARGLKITARSRLFRTPAFPAGSGPDFVNAAFSVETDLSALALLDLLHSVEHDLGRTRQTRWEARVLDLDLLALGDRILPDAESFDHWFRLSLEDQMVQAPDQLILPHPRLQDRSFVLVPLMDIAPDWRHPRLGLTVAEMLAKLPAGDLASIVPLE